jgi:hypothetical protein
MPSIRTERLEIAYQQYGPGSQAPLFWYQWFMSLAGGPAPWPPIRRALPASNGTPGARRDGFPARAAAR